MNQILDFMCYLFDRLNLKPTTIGGYRAMLAPVVRSRGIDLSNDKTMSDLMASFRTQRPMRGPVLPEWTWLSCFTVSRGPHGSRWKKFPYSG